MLDRTDYLLEAEKDLNDSNTYKEVKFGDNKLLKLVKESNRMFLKRLYDVAVCPVISVIFLWHTHRKNVRILGLLPETYNAFSKVLHKRDQ